MKNKSNPLAKVFFFSLVIAVLFSGPLQATETIVPIANQGNMSYFKPEVKIAPNNDIYVVYQAQVAGGGRSDIYLSKYSEGKVSFVKNISDSAQYSYEPEIDIANDNTLHMAWADQTNDTHVIKYRSFNGSTWSAITTMGQVTATENIEDLRIAVDPAGNVFIVFMHWPAARCKLISKYGVTVNFEDFSLPGRSKHPDVVADSNYIHVVFQYKDGDEYTIAYQRRPNHSGSSWQPWMDLKFYGTQRPRMDLDSSNAPHVAFFENFGSTRNLWYKKWNGNGFDAPKIMSDPSGAETYHFCDISASDSNNIIVTMQKGGWSGGQKVCYNWKRNGEWGGFSFFSESHHYKPTKQSIDLDPDRFFAALAFAHQDSAVYLILAEEQGGPGNDAPTASFTFSPQTGHAPLNITFDASGSSDSDGQIVSYQWNFGDTLMGTGQVIQHSYPNQGEYTVTLTVTDNDGKSASTTHTVIVEPPNQPPQARFTCTPKQGLYPLQVNFDGRTSSDADGQVVQYEWDFGGEQTGSGAITTYTFNEKGIYQVTLTVYDDDNDISTATDTIEVLGLLSPLNIAYEAKINRNVFILQQVYYVTWEPNPGNANRGANIIRYNLYRRPAHQGEYTFVASVQATEPLEYYDRIGRVPQDLEYTVTAVDDQERESDLPTNEATPGHSSPATPSRGNPLTH